MYKWINAFLYTQAHTHVVYKPAEKWTWSRGPHPSPPQLPEHLHLPTGTCPHPPLTMNMRTGSEREEGREGGRKGGREGGREGESSKLFQLEYNTS